MLAKISRMSDFPSLARRTVERIETLGALTDEPGVLFRSFLSPAMAQANQLVGQWFAESLGCTTNVDSWGNLIAYIPSWSDPEAPVLLLGSHLDTVRNAGKYDGMLGVLVALASLEALAEEKFELPFAVEVIGFSDEEGARYQHAYLGSKAYSGQITKADLALQDKAGGSLGETVAQFQKLTSPDDLSLPTTRYEPEQVLGYVELHIEQGPVLESLNLPVGVVTSIAAQTRVRATIFGKAGHAGTTPMHLRQDALAAAAECVLAVEKLGQSLPNLVATVGQLEVQPSVSNVIPANVVFSIDVRHASSDVVSKSCDQIFATISSIVSAREVACSLIIVQQNNGVASNHNLVGQLERAVATQQSSVPMLTSGAGHDGIIMSKLTGIAMLFVRSRDGLSHHPDEFTSEPDIEAAIQAFTTFLRNFKPA